MVIVLFFLVDMIDLLVCRIEKERRIKFEFFVICMLLLLILIWMVLFIVLSVVFWLRYFD